MIASRPIQDKGAYVDCLRSFRFPVYEPGRLPSPTDCPQCLIVINDPNDGNPQGYLALSNGASWDRLGELTEAQIIKFMPAAASVQTVDIAPAPAPRVQITGPPHTAQMEQTAELAAKVAMLERNFGSIAQAYDQSMKGVA